MRRFRKPDIKSIFLNNFWLKLISLILAIIVWLYVNGILTEGTSL